jgi:glycine dehydrogenase subunit 1
VYTPHTKADVEAMLRAIGVDSVEELLAVPDALKVREPLDVVPAMPEYRLRNHIERIGARSAGTEYVSFLGGGAYRHYAPPAIGALAMRGEFLTAYTPYQAEVSQGYLQAIYEWQSYICLLTGMDLADASVYDGATALAESAIMAINATGRRKFLVSRAVNPNYRAVLKTYCSGLDVDVDEAPVATDGTTDLAAFADAVASRKYAGAALQSPNFFGSVDALDARARDALRDSGTVPIAVVAEALSLGALATPASWGAQIVAGEAQSFGVPLAYGGPHVGFIATTQEHIRRIPGRLAGKTVDSAGRTAYVLTLQAREQHIRRERATSNICTNQAHCALIATIYLALLGETGLRNVAALNLERSRELAAAVADAGMKRRFSAPFFNEVTIDVGRPARDVLDILQERRILGGLDLGRWYPEYDECIVMAATELTSPEEIAALATALREVGRVGAAV